MTTVPHLVDPETKILMLLAHAALGRRIFPTAWIEWQGSIGTCSCRNAGCVKPGKHPRVQDWPNEATTDADKILSWHSWVPNANWGWVQDTTFTLDVDPSRDGLNSLAQWEENAGGPNTTFRQKTQSGGWHYVYRQTDPPLRQQGDILNGIEIRGVGSYIMLGGVSVGLGGAWTLVDPDAEIVDADDFTQRLIESNGLLLDGDDGDGVERRGKRQKSGSTGDTSERLPSTDQFMTRGLGWFSGSRNRDAYRLAWRLLRLGDVHPQTYTTVRIAGIMKTCWVATDQGDSPFTWDECLGTLQSAWRRKTKQDAELAEENRKIARALIGKSEVTL